MAVIQPGTVLADRFELTVRLGSGAMGEVWRARDRGLMSRDVAIKLMTGSPDPDLVKRFVREARVASELENPHILRVFDIAEQDGHLYIVMELLEGEDLAKGIRGRALSVDRAVELGIQLADGLAAVHAANIVHRDLKPANIFVRSDGRLKICDFGIARDNDESGAGSGSMVGTPVYMPPERLIPHERVEPSSDLWAVGCIIYQMLTGRHPFASGTSDSGELFRRIVNENPRPPRELTSQVPGALNDIVLDLLAKNPSKRPTAAQLKVALERIQCSVGETATETIAVDVSQPIDARRIAALPGPQVFVLIADTQLRRKLGPDWLDMPLPPGRATAIAALSWKPTAVSRNGARWMFPVAVGDTFIYQILDREMEIAVAVGGAVYHRRWAGKGPGGADWDDWRASPGPGTQVIDMAFSATASQTANNKPVNYKAIYALDDGGRIYLRWEEHPDSSPPGWRDNEGWPLAPAAAADWSLVDTPDGRPATAIATAGFNSSQLLFAILDGELWHRSLDWQRSGWSSRWHQNAPIGMRATDVAVSGAAIFASDDSGRLRHQWYPWYCAPGSFRADWSPWEEFHAPYGARPSAITFPSEIYPPGSQEIFLLEADGRVIHAGWRGAPPSSSWTPKAQWSQWAHSFQSDVGYVLG